MLSRIISRTLSPGPAARLLLAIVPCAVSGCSTGVMKLDETHYYAPVNESNTNYYRLRIHATTKLGVSQYRSGWFAATSVDRLFGKVDDESGVKALETRTAIETILNQKIESTYQAWLDAAASPAANVASLDALLAAQRRVLAYPLLGGGEPYPGALEVEYNPAKGIAIRRWDEKLVFILSSNPDDVVGKIANFSESDQTTRTINRLGQVLANRAKGDVAAKEATLKVRSSSDALVVASIQRASDAAAAVKDASNKTAAIRVVTQELQALLSMLEVGQP